MNILSNIEFEHLSKDVSKRLASISAERCSKYPNGFLSLEDLKDIRAVLQYSGDHKSVKWVDSLRGLAINGALGRIRTGHETVEDHINYVHTIYAQNKIPFDINDSVLMQDTGKRGKVIDYIPSADEYIVILSPFQWKQYPAKDLKKLARKI